MQRHIDFGAFPDDNSADAIRTAFMKVQQNFDELFNRNNDMAQGVMSINRQNQPGIMVSSTTGNVLISANISNVQVYSSSLALGLSVPNNVGYVSMTNSNQSIHINLKDNTSIKTSLFVGNPDDPNVSSYTTLIHLGNITTSGKVTAGYLQGNGSNISNIAGANVTGQVPNALIAGTVYASAQPNIRSVGTLTSLNVTGNITSNTRVTASTIAGSLVTNAQPNITSVGTLTSLNVTGNVSAGNISANRGAFTTVTGNGAGLTALPGANVTGQVPNALIAGTVYASAQPNIRSVGTLTALNVTGNVSAGNVSANRGAFTTVTGNGAGLTALPGANVTGQVPNALVAGTVYTNAQPNITSVGTLTSLNVSGAANLPNITTSLIRNGNSNVVINQNGNIVMTAGGLERLRMVASTGYVGIGTANPEFMLEVNGSFAAVTKSFLIDHPTIRGYKLRYGSLESPYHGIRLTGEATVVNGIAIVDLPHYVCALCTDVGAQVQITNKGHFTQLAVTDIGVRNNRFIVESQDRNFTGSFYWSFTAIRKDIEEMVVEFPADDSE